MGQNLIGLDNTNLPHYRHNHSEHRPTSHLTIGKIIEELDKKKGRNWQIRKKGYGTFYRNFHVIFRCERMLVSQNTVRHVILTSVSLSTLSD